jgi:hypothetical protein
VKKRGIFSLFPNLLHFILNLKNDSSRRKKCGAFHSQKCMD